MSKPSTRHLVLAGAAIVGAATAATSAVSLYELAVMCGIPAPLAAALPIALDAGAAVAALVWITERGELRSWGRGIALAALTATLVGNGLAHAITAGLLTVTLPLVLAVGACIPGMLFACVHLAALMAQPAARNGNVAAPRAAAAKPRITAPGTGTVAEQVAVVETEPPTELASKQAASGAAIDWARDSWPCSAREIADATGVAKASSHRIRNKVAAEQEVSA